MNLVLENSLKNCFSIRMTLLKNNRCFGKGEQLLVRSVINDIYIFCSIGVNFFFQIDHTFVSNTPLGP